MAQSDSAKLIVAWKRAYEQLSEYSMEQFKLVKDHPDSEQLWNQIGDLSEKKAEVQAEIDRLQVLLEQEIGSERMKEIFQQDIRSSAESARLLTFETARKIEIMMLSKGSELGTVKTQRKAFNAYTGMNSDEQVAYFFDEKK